MNKSLVYKILYYLSFVFTLGLVFFLTRLDEDLYLNMATNYQLLMIVVNVLLVIIFSVKLRKNKLDNTNIAFPINYLVFSILVILIAFLMNSKLILTYVQFGYYINFILFSYLLLNVYSVLCFERKKDVLEEEKYDSRRKKL